MSVAVAAGRRARGVTQRLAHSQSGRPRRLVAAARLGVAHAADLCGSGLGWSANNDLEENLRTISAGELCRPGPRRTDICACSCWVARTTKSRLVVSELYLNLHRTSGRAPIRRAPRRDDPKVDPQSEPSQPGPRLLAAAASRQSSRVEPIKFRHNSRLGDEPPRGGYLTEGEGSMARMIVGTGTGTSMISRQKPGLKVMEICASSITESLTTAIGLCSCATCHVFYVAGKLGRPACRNRKATSWSCSRNCPIFQRKPPLAFMPSRFHRGAVLGPQSRPSPRKSMTAAVRGGSLAQSGRRTSQCFSVCRRTASCAARTMACCRRGIGAREVQLLSHCRYGDAVGILKSTMFALGHPCRAS